uniref:Uncharacterized protein n=1 Tax=Anguilla anguilla TaxID=7936 RepID=A0A0E9VL86_ANGAN
MGLVGYRPIGSPQL